MSKTVRDYIAALAGIPAPPPDATHVMVWEPYGPSRSQWALGALDGFTDDDALGLLDGPPDAGSPELAEQASSLLGCPVRLHSRIEYEGEYACYVTALEES